MPMRVLKWMLMVVLSHMGWLGAKGQLILPDSIDSGRISLHAHALIAPAEGLLEDPERLLSLSSKLDFKAVEGPASTLGFTSEAYWVKFELRNDGNNPFSAYLETARPITDRATLFLLKENGEMETQMSGDRMAFDERPLPHRKTLFRIALDPGESVSAFLYLESDGEVINLPLLLLDGETLLAQSYLEQGIFGLFYGILLLALVTYLFFYFALGDRSFLHYSLYVLFVGLMQFSLDGYFYQYFAPSGGWLNARAVLIFAALSVLFFGLYNKVFLRIGAYSRKLVLLFQVCFVALGALLMLIVFSAQLPAFAYPAANALGMVVLLLSVASIAIRILKRDPVDVFFTAGISFLVAGYVVFILSNFSVIGTSFLAENAAKFGTGLEVVLLSLSMANRIRILKSEKEHMQSLALKRSEEMNEIKSYFLSNMSHELRTPLNAIMALSDLMMQEGEDPHMKANCEVIRAASIGLLTSVNDILDFSKIEKGELRLDRQEFSLQSTLLPILQTIESQARQKGLAFTSHFTDKLPPKVEGDPMRIGQIAQNLLQNAVKFTPEGYVRFSVEATPSGGDNVLVRLLIEDSGIGIPAHKIDSLFESFSQENISHKRKFGGLGLGLSIVKQLVDLHGGTITIESTVEVGTVCTVEIPYHVVEIALPQQACFPKDHPDLGGRHILVVEDNPVNQLVVKSILKKWDNTTVSVANHGLEALGHLRSEGADLILMDLQMPEMDGYEATEAIRRGEAGEALRHIPIIALTADVAESSRKRVFEIGMDAYLTKPVDKALLYETVTSVLSQKVLEQARG